MAGGIPRQPLVLVSVLLAVFVCCNAAAGPLVSYSFDDDQLDTGPDTFRIFEHSRGRVRLSPEFRYSGYYAVEIRDEADDGGFPELQGYFPMQASGTLHVHFAFMTPEPLQPFNIALAGPRWFSMQPDGIGFWLKNKDGYFYHVSDSMPKRLAPIQPFTWYLVDLTYRVGAGTYDLVIQEEYAEQPLVNIKEAANTTRSQNSKVYVFSFIGDLPDEANAVLYVDDIIIRSHTISSAPELLAPGRRKLFVDYWRDLQKTARQTPQCVPTTGFSDFGISNDELEQAEDSGLLKNLEQLLQAPGHAITPGLIDDLPANLKLRAVAMWRRGCYLLEQHEAEQALDYFREAEVAAPTGRIYNLSSALALAAMGEILQVDFRIATAYGLWYGDERLAAAQAMIGLARDDHWSSETVLQETVRLLPAGSGVDIWANSPDSELMRYLRQHYPDDWNRYLRARLLLEQYYFLLLWRGAYAEALAFAQSVATHLEQKTGSAGVWYEFMGNAAFLLDDHEQALDNYELALRANKDFPARVHSVYLKLSDLFFTTGDAENERYYREQVYGRLVQ
jgi:tetratricopeptide (TPR) repeat protein